MKNQLFESIDFDNDPYWIVKEFFNSIYEQGRFLWALPLIFEKKGCAVNKEYCFFSDLNDSDPSSHFSGVMFGTFEDQVIVSSERCLVYLKIACDRYLEENPEDRSLVTSILDESRAQE